MADVKEARIAKPGVHVIAESALSSTLFSIPNETIVQVSCGQAHSALLCQSGRVFVFGMNDHCQLGLSGDTAVSRPKPLTNLSTNVCQVACGGEFTLFLFTGGEVYGSGSNSHGQFGLGDQNKTTRTVLVRVPGIPLIKMIATGDRHAVVVSKMGEVFVVGSNDHGQLGIRHDGILNCFRIVPYVLASITSVSCGWKHTALLESSGSLFMTGLNDRGQLGLGHKSYSGTFQPVTLPSSVKAFACGQYHTVTLLSNGEVWAWGSNLQGQLGIGTNNSCSFPTKMIGLGSHIISEVFAGAYNTALITKDGNMLMCGKVHTVPLGKDEKPPNVPSLVSRSTGLMVNNVAFAETHAVVSTVASPESAPLTEVTGSISSLESVILKTLECPVCFRVMCAPIFLCTEGHKVCDSCRKCTSVCSSCQKPFTDARNFDLESLSAETQLPCTNCWERLPTNLLEKHDTVCPNRTYGCPMPTPCGWMGRSAAIVDHVTSTHPDQVWLDSPHSFTHEHSTDVVQTNVLIAHGRVFLVHCMHAKATHVFHATVMLIGPTQDCAKYKCQFEFMNAKHTCWIGFEINISVDTINALEIFKINDDCIELKEGTLDLFLDGQKIMCKVTILKVE